MIPIEQFYRFVTPFAPTASEPAMLNALRAAAKEYCAETKVWDVYLDPIVLINGEADYELDTPDDDAELDTVLHAYFGDRPVFPAGPHSLAARYRNWTRQQGAPWCYQLRDVDDVTYMRFVPIPTAEDDGKEIDVRLSFVPKQDADTFPDVLYEGHADALAAGALERLLLEPGANYMNPALAADFRNKFRVAKAAARIEFNRGNVPAQVMVRMTPAA